MTSASPDISERLAPDTDRLAVAMIRGLALDAPHAARSGHQGTALALAPLAHVLYSRVLRHDPADPQWVDRDRLILSNGHASVLQYAMLYLNGYGLELDDLRAFRQWGSRTPGHPEVGHTPGVEVTTGPLGQGLANAVGMAIAERYLRTRFGAEAIDHHIYVIAGDGCLMEGLSHEAASLAGHLGLGRLICVFDDNRITIDGSTDLSTSDDVARRFDAYGWNVVELGEIGEDLDALEEALVGARADETRPSLLILRTHIGYPSPDHTDDHEAHGLAFSEQDIARTKAVLAIPDEPFWVDTDVVERYREVVGRRGAAEHSQWVDRSAAVRGEQSWQAAFSTTGLAGWQADLPVFEPGTALATRQAFQKVLDSVGAEFPGLLAGSADLTGNTGTRLPAAEAQSALTPGGRQIYYGVREHAMGAVMVGLALHGGILPVGGTFLVFADYMRPALRLAALSGAKVCFVFTHDSVGVGEDGPTHQPVEQVMSLRAIPGLRVLRPADANETVAAWRAIVDHDGPTAIVLTRQSVPVVTDGSAVGAAGAIVSVPGADEHTDVDIVLVASGSEVAVCVEAAQHLLSAGIGVRVISVPDLGAAADRTHGIGARLIPADVPVLSVEAGVTLGWSILADRSIGIDRFGASAPGGEVLERLGISVANIVSVVNDMLADRARGHLQR